MLVEDFMVVATLFSAQAVLSADKVHLDVYYESLCPGCQDFFVNQLRPVSKELYKYMETNLVPYGNANTSRNGDEVTFSCQHGPSECLFNKIHACAFARVRGPNLVRVLLASCLFDYFQNPTIAGMMCCPAYGVKWSEVLACANGREGITLLDKYGNETNSLNPPHTFVPTFAINKYRGDFDFQIQIDSNLKKVICSTLAKEKITPEACKQ